MGAVKNLIDKKALRDLVPINALSEVHIEEISEKAIIEDVRSGRFVFKKGDRDYQSVYLLEGTVELIGDGRAVVSTVTAGSEAARHPLAHKQPRQLSARASGKVTVARIDSSLLDVLLTWDESSGYDVVEIDAEEDDDWMTRMLQSQAFMQLPPSNIHQLLMRLETITAEAGEVIVKQGGEGDYFYIVKHGRLAVTRKASARTKEVLLAELGEGACFGEEALVSGGKRNASVTMVTDGSLMRLSKDDFQELLCAPLVHEVDFRKAQELVAQGAKWLDVRLPGEIENQSIKESINLPLSALRDQCGELDKSVAYVVCCDTGRRSSAGAFVLSQRGFTVYVLKKGLMNVPEEALTQALAGPQTQAGGNDAEIIPFGAEGKSHTEPAKKEAVQAARQQSADGGLQQRLDVVEAEKVSLQKQLTQIQKQLSATQARLKESDALRADEQAVSERVIQQIETLERELEQAKKEGAGPESHPARDKAQDSLLKRELEQMVGRLEDERQAHEKQTKELKQALNRAQADYQQLGQRASALAGERDAAFGDLEKAKQELESFREHLSAQRGESDGQVAALKKSLEQRGEELEKEKKQRQSLEQRLGELESSSTEARQQLKSVNQRAEQQESERTRLAADLEQSIKQRRELEQALKQAQDNEQTLQVQLKQAERKAGETVQQLRSETSGAQEQLNRQIAGLQAELDERDKASKEQHSQQQALQHKLDEVAQALKDANEREQSLQQQLQQAEQKARDELEKQRSDILSEKDELNQRIEALQARVDEQEKQAQQLESQRQESERKLKEAEQTLEDAAKREQQARDELHNRQDNTDQIRQELDQARQRSEDLHQLLEDSRKQTAGAEQKAAELESGLKSARAEYESDVASVRDALARAQDERENVKREQTRLMDSLRKAEANLEKERHDHETQVRRLRKELKETAGESNAGLASELEAVQEQVRQAVKHREELEIQLGERSGQLEDVQAQADKLSKQLEQAQASARQAEQQLVEANQAANEEMTLRLDAEQKAQQALRDQLTAVTAERNDVRERLTVQSQELEELRNALQEARSEMAANEDSEKALQRAEKQLQGVTEALQQAEHERDQALAGQQEAQQELDRLRAEAEVTRGLVDTQAPVEEADGALRDELEQVKQNVEVAVRLRTQAEEQAAELREEVTRLQAALGEADVGDGSDVEAIDIPSLDVDDEQLSSALTADVDAALSGGSAAESGVLLDEDEAALQPSESSHRETAGDNKGGGRKGLVAGVLLLTLLAVGGAYWWFKIQPAAQTADVRETAATPASGTPRKEDSPGVVQEAERAIQDPNELVQEQEPEAVFQEAVVQEPEAAVQEPEAGAEASAKVVDEPLEVATEPEPVPEQAEEAVPATKAERRNVSPFMRGMTDTRKSVSNQEASEGSTPLVEQSAAEQPMEEPSDAPVAKSESGSSSNGQPARTLRDKLSSGGTAPTMVELQADSFQMGSGSTSQNFDERPKHRVNLARFAISKHEVTFEQYDRFAKKTGRARPKDGGWGRGKRPVVNVSWKDAVAYTRWLSKQTGQRYRLPTEAEWEFAARSGSVKRYWWGHRVGKGNANCFDCSTEWAGRLTAPVGSFQANSYGLHDTAGNAREWVQDCYTPNYTEAPEDGTAVEFAGCKERVIRGGSYGSPSSKLRSAARDRGVAGSRLDDLGFRVVREF